MPPPSLTFKLLDGYAISHDTLAACATLFSSNYGVWSAAVSPPLRPGARVKMTTAKLRRECLGDPARSFLALCTNGEGNHIGHAFATVWEYSPGKTICWVTQLVVCAEYRRRAVATSLLCLFPRADCMGIASSHPAACLTLAKSAHANMRKVDLEFLKSTASVVLPTSPVTYLRSGILRGSLFEEPANATPMVSALFTDFPVDHAEPTAARELWEERNDLSWPLGRLGPGHEFLYIVPVAQG
ncbi:hypothetical protein MKEN_00383300 [Mycena kentingensis (nom. inval.)]|nr:hypothetical protein MKEN_00383300 [Mycena kentingensis (nom. inval.)]